MKILAAVMHSSQAATPLLAMVEMCVSRVAVVFQARVGQSRLRLLSPLVKAAQTQGR